MLIDEPVNSFFNLFSNFQTPKADQKDLNTKNYSHIKEMTERLDMELAFASEVINEIIPRSFEYFCGVKFNTDEIIDFMQEHETDFDGGYMNEEDLFMNFASGSKDSRKKKKKKY